MYIRNVIKSLHLTSSQHDMQTVMMVVTANGGDGGAGGAARGCCAGDEGGGKEGFGDGLRGGGGAVEACRGWWGW